MRTEEQVLRELTEWARQNDLVRAAVLTSSRATPGRPTDFLSDYDVELYVADLTPFRAGDGWLNAFGEVLVRWPLRPRTTFNEEWLTRLVLYRDDVRIDFQISERRKIAAGAYDDGCKVLVDKDGVTAGLAAPICSTHHITKPSRDEYETLVYEFWWNASYVPKCLWRDELPFAKSMMGQLHDEYLTTVIEWSIGLARGWSVNTGVRGRWSKRYLDEATWCDYEGVFARAGLKENWEAFFAAVDLFGRLAAAVGAGLGYDYPARLQQDMTQYYRRIRSTDHEAAGEESARGH